MANPSVLPSSAISLSRFMYAILLGPRPSVCSRMAVHDDGKLPEPSSSIELSTLGRRSNIKSQGKRFLAPYAEEQSHPNNISVTHASRAHIELASIGDHAPNISQSGSNPLTSFSPVHRSTTRLLKPLQAWWSNNIVLSLDHIPRTPSINSDPRDYLALERTYLAYVRTSVALVSFGIVLLQLFILHNVSRTTGICLAAACSGAGFLVSLLGCWRYFVQQKTLERGRAKAGGWDILAIGTLFLALVIAVLIAVMIQS